MLLCDLFLFFMATKIKSRLGSFHVLLRGRVVGEPGTVGALKAESAGGTRPNAFREGNFLHTSFPRLLHFIKGL